MNYDSVFSRNIGAISEREQKKLKEARAAVIGCGGIGGLVIEMIARSGVGKLRIADRDVFEASNLNRQVLSSKSALGKKKVEVARAKILEVNDEATVEVFEEVNEKNAKKFLSEADVVVDAVDSVLSRVIVNEEARRMRVPYVFAAAEKTSALCSVFSEKTKSYAEVFCLPKEKEKLAKMRGAKPILGVTANVAGCLAAAQAIKILLGKKTVCAPNFICFDLEELELFSLRRI
ncbi:MAG: ThiF family adenylyltransferase [Candidatus Micrarchaeota archaeon]